MPTTFNVISLGVQAIIDPTEGNDVAENASALVGQTFGGWGNALAGRIQTFSQGPLSSTWSKDGNAYYDQNDTAAETFRINGGPTQGFDASVIYNATLTYLDGTTATITAVVFQDTAGRTYLAPELDANADQAALNAKPILSLRLDSLVSNTYAGMTANRQAFNAVTCYVTGTRIATPDGLRAAEQLAVGDQVLTQDRGAQVLRWVGRSTHAVTEALAPIRIAAGALGGGLPTRDLLVSPQHRMLLRSRIAARMTGHAEVFVPAKKLLGLPGVTREAALGEVTYVHFMCDHHEIVFAEGAPSETLLPAPQALAALGGEAVEELQALFPELLQKGLQPARPIPLGRIQRRLVERHVQNLRTPLSAA